MFVQYREETKAFCFAGQQSGHRWYHIVSASVLDLLMAKTPPRGPCVQFVRFGNDITPPSSVPIFTNVSLAVRGSLGH